VTKKLGRSLGTGLHELFITRPSAAWDDGVCRHPPPNRTFKPLCNEKNSMVTRLT